MQRRTFLHTGALALTAATTGAFAQSTWPAKPIKLIVPFPPGGGTDATSRLIAEKFTVLNQWTVVVENRPGAAGNIGLDVVAKAQPDGYTIGMGQASNLSINPALYAKMPFDPLKDFTPIVEIAVQPVVLVVRADSPLRTLADFIKAAKAKPGDFSIAHAGNGTVGHLAGEMLARRAGIEVLQVPYKGAGPAMNELLGGQVQLYFGNSVSVMSQMNSGRVRALAVSSAQRLPVIGQVPTVAEQGYAGFDATTWLGLVGPAGMPADVVARVNKEVGAMLARKDVQDKLAFEGNIPVTGTPQQFAAFIKAEHTKWGSLIREANIKLE
ncbi:tripartite tricarboxylate transporter substrate binding protein [Acidovorax sp. CCYZU-2555]|uniref:Bug family tripartite tricarboxylate transporter substrate binding protein n=1 Tax=Acidovorax sp. CCYZU-2555 TaxID=2835042 RepID=UPI001BCB4CC0|nr:tripartite tricarboxylate transporter substrate binding protein [Acidovorax sp. CCYZU-2555]MBS7777502.1 tripartite tricarboxylate transporter substrate binding protein [Acidovorax sp. CCYZU-2555]